MSVALALNKDGTERLEYNAFGFPIKAVDGVLSVFANYTAACHWHHDCEFLLVNEGEINYFANGAIVHVDKGQGIFVNSGRLHYGFSPVRQECLFSVVVFHPSLLGEPPLPTAEHMAALAADGQIDCLLLDPKDDAGLAILTMLQQIGALCQAREELYEFDVTALCGGVIKRLYQVARPSAQERRQDPAWSVLRRMTGYLQQNYAQSVRLADVAAAGAVCRSKCCELFRSRLGKTPMEYLARYRLEKGMMLLQSTGLSVTEVAQSVGFEGASYFAEQFRRYYGMSPRRFRARQAEGAPSA